MPAAEASTQSVEADGEGRWRVRSVDIAREIVLTPGERQRVRMLASSLVRGWVGSDGPAYLRIRVEEPAESARPPGAIRIVSSGGVLGRLVALVR